LCGVTTSARTSRMSIERLAVSFALAFVISAAVCVAARSFARRHELLDRPNERSLHEVPVPRLGGVGGALGCLVPLALLPWSILGSRDVLIWIVGAVLVSAIGFLDDVRGLPVGVRLALQLAIAGSYCATLAPLDHFSLTAAFALEMPNWLMI